MLKKGKLTNLFVLLLLVFMLSCENESSDSEKESSVKITKLGWVIENMDPSYWIDTVESTCFYNFWIHYDSSAVITVNDIEYARVCFEGSPDSEDSYWWGYDLEANPELLNSERKCIGGWYRWYTYDYSYNGSMLPIGKLIASIKLKGEEPATFELIVPAPGSLTSGNYRYTYTENYNGSIPSFITPMIQKADVVSGSVDLSTEKVSISFKTGDERVYNGWVWFYNANGKTVGNTKEMFRNFETKIFTSLLNNGNGVYYNNTANLIEVTKDNIVLNSPYTFADIKYAIIILTDGMQYSDDSVKGYDCRSLSKKFQLTIN